MFLLFALFTGFTPAALAEDDSAPFTWDPTVDTSITVAAALCFATTNYLIEPAIPVEYTGGEPGPLDTIALDRWNPTLATSSDVLLYSSLAGGLAATSIVSARGGNWAPLGLYVESLSIAGTAINVIKMAVDRPRPFTHMSDPPAEVLEEMEEADALMSFPSGHTGTEAVVTFTTASVLVAYGMKPLPAWLGAGALTGAMGVLRVGAGKHYPTDVTVGAAIGAAVGLSVPALHRVERGLARLNDDPTTSPVALRLQSRLPGSEQAPGLLVQGVW